VCCREGPHILWRQRHPSFVGIHSLVFRTVVGKHSPNIRQSPNDHQIHHIEQQPNQTLCKVAQQWHGDIAIHHANQERRQYNEESDAQKQ